MSEPRNRLKGISPSSLNRIEKQRVLWMAEEVLKGYALRGDALNNAEDTKRYLRVMLGALEREELWAVLLDNRHQIIATRRIAMGTINGAEVHPRELTKRALEHNAAAVIVAHNHPSGVAEPSYCDVQMTRRLKSALSLVDVRVLDHVVVGPTSTASLAEQGLF